jgi:hypothetical protein
MNEFLARWESESPKFFKKLIKFGKWLSGLSAAVYAATASIPNASLPTIVNQILGYTTVIGAVIVAVASLAVKDTVELENKIESK